MSFRLFCGALLLTASAGAWSLTATPFVEAHTGSMGTGGEVGVDFGPIRVRGHFSRYDFSENDVWSGTRYGVSTRLGGSGVLVDLAPWDGSFFISAGLFINDVRIDAASEQGDFDIGGQTVHDARIFGKAEFSERVPWLGFGWRFFHNGEKRGLGGSVDIGAWFNGEPEVEVWTDQPAFDAHNRRAIEQEEEEIEDDIRNGDILPVIKVGVMYYF